jgi:polar amino acid transport system permease protein
VSIEDDRTGTADIKAVPVRHPGRWVAAAVVAVLVAMLINSFATNSRYGWSTIGHYLFAGQILRGVRLTLALTAIAMLIGIVGGVLLAIMRLSPNPVLTAASSFYIWFFRGTPVLVQIVMWFNLSFLFPHISIGIPFGPEFVTFSTNSLISKFTAAALGLGLNEAAYMAEIVRAGILSVDEGQSEAASALGMRRVLVLRRIVLPQAMRVIIPPTGNETISMLKTTSVVIYIALADLFTAVQGVIDVNYQTIPLYLVACIWYLAMTTVLTVGQGFLERHFGRGSNRRQPKSGLAQIWSSIRFGRPRLSGYEDVALGGTQ